MQPALHVLWADFLRPMRHWRVPFVRVENLRRKSAPLPVKFVLPDHTSRRRNSVPQRPRFAPRENTPPSWASLIVLNVTKAFMRTVMGQKNAYSVLQIPCQKVGNRCARV